MLYNIIAKIFDKPQKFCLFPLYPPLKLTTFNAKPPKLTKFPTQTSPSAAHSSSFCLFFEILYINLAIMPRLSYALATP